MNVPILALTIGDLRRYGLQPASSGPLTQVEHRGRIPLVDVGTLKLIEQGHIQVRPGIEKFTQDQVIFTDGRAEDYDAVILATGYRPRVNAFLQGDSSLDKDGSPLISGREAPASGLYFCGFYISPTGMLREIAIEARRISSAIARKQRPR